MSEKARRYVCIHGHFYQPPRENPWLEAIERQQSAWPSHDWNERVTDECYAPNAHARMLDADGQIRAITNNYARLSFNFGPTLLSWMESARPDVYRSILAADVESRARFGGHGSALAQVYNHMILPLANRRDKVTQVRWGVRDFERRFGRKPEGMWLAETAVDVESLEVLAEHGVAYTILAPHQCREVRPPNGAWTDVSGQRVDPRRPYLARLPSGRSIALFFYDGPMSRAVAFERLLDDGHRFANRLLGLFVPSQAEPQLVHIATDGETYGHHHSYGEMALAVALDRLDRDARVELTNYGQLLATHPPTWEARILEDSSWSCAHGVERWRSDCGCNSGTGWHQRWRAPLREALDWLRDELAPRYEEAASALFRDPWEARDAYIDVVLDRSDETRRAFFESHASGELDAATRRRALELCEMQRHAMLMYTSCGWFFDELSGIETVQVMQYAARALTLASGLFGDRFEPGFLERLALAPSNRPEYGDGLGVYRALVEPSIVDLAKAGAHLAVASVLGRDRPAPSEPITARRARLVVGAPREERPGKTVELGGGFAGDRVERDLMRTGGSRLAVGRLRVRSRITTETDDFTYAVLHFGDHNVLGGIRPYGGAARHMALHGALSQAFSRADLTEVVRQIEHSFEGETFSLRSLFHDEQAAILDRLLAERTRAAEETYESIYDGSAPLMRFLESLGQPPPAVFKAAAEYTLMARLRRELSSGRHLELGRVRALIEEAAEASVALDPLALGMALQQSLEALLAELAEEPEDDELLGQLERVARLVHGSAWKMDLGDAQNAVWQLTRTLLPRWREEDPDRAEQLRTVASHLRVLS